MELPRILALAVILSATLAGGPGRAQERTEEDKAEQGAGPAEVGPQEVEVLIASAPVTGSAVPTAAASTPGLFALPASAEAYGPYSNIMPLAGGAPLDAGAPAGALVLPSLVSLAVLPFDTAVPPATLVPPVVVAAPPALPAVASPPVTLATSPDTIGPVQFPAPPPPNAYGPRGPAQTASGS